MGVYMPMSTTGRHIRISGTFFGTVLDLLRKKEVYALQEECALVHWGYKGKSDLKKLVDVSNTDEIGDIDEFVKITINELDYVMPDFILFKNNKYLHNDRETKIAGCPDLIVEVWSKANLKDEREFKLALYSSSPAVEHWYIEQDSNEVTCFLGRDKIENQSLIDILITQGGIKFDLQYLAI
jgi:hypothetical protein